jgi:hypothetical protein
MASSLFSCRIRFQGVPLVEELEKHCFAAEARAAQDEESERQKQAATLTALAVATMAEENEEGDGAVDSGSDNTPLPGSIASLAAEQNPNSSQPPPARSTDERTAKRSLTIESRRSSFKAVAEAARLKRQEQREITDSLNMLIKQTLRNCYTQGPLFILLMAWPFLRASLALILPLILSGASTAIFPIIRSLPSRLTAPSALVRVIGSTADADGPSSSTVGASRVRLRSESATRASTDLSSSRHGSLRSMSASASASVAPDSEFAASAGDEENLVAPSGL